jgi:hypothetical protein
LAATKKDRVGGPFWVNFYSISILASPEKSTAWKRRFLLVWDEMVRGILEGWWG